MKYMKRGFTIIEVITAIFILTMGVSAAFALIQGTLTFSKTTSARLTSAYLAQEGLEIIRNIRDSNWLEQRDNPALAWDYGISVGSSYGLDYQSSVFPDSLCSGEFLKFDGNYFNCRPVSSSNIQTNFKREITVQKPVGKMIVQVKVSWTGPSGTQQVQAETELYNWK